MKQPIDPSRIEVPDPAIIAILKTKTPAERLAMAFAANRTMRLRIEGHLRTYHSDWSDEEIQKEEWREGCWVEQQDLVRKVIEVFERQRLAYMIVGSLASGVYGEPRLTQDIDVVVALPAADVGGLCSAFPAPDFYVSEAAARQAALAGGQFNIIHPASGNKIDVMIARRDAWGRSQLARRRREQIFADLAGFVAAPEDIIIGKMWYYQEGGSEKHLRDVAAMLKATDVGIDRPYIEHWSRELGLIDVWQALLLRLGNAT